MSDRAAAAGPADDVMLYPPVRALLILLRTVWRERRCAHPQWTPLDKCPDCGKEPQ